MNFLNKSVFLLLFIACLACSKWEEAPVISRLKVVHAHPDIESINVLVNNNLVASLTYSGENEYFRLRSGRSNLQLTMGEQNPLLAGEVYLTENSDYSAFFLKNANNKDTLLFREDTLTNPGVGRANIRFAHLSPELSAVNLLVYKAPDTLRFNNRSFLNISTFATIASGEDYNFMLIHGKDTLGTSTFDLSTERVYTIMAVGYDSLTEGNANKRMLKLDEEDITTR